MVVGFQPQHLARHHGAEPEGDFTSVCALDVAVQEQCSAVLGTVQ